MTHPIGPPGPTPMREQACPGCAARYEVTMRDYPVRQSDVARCVVCGCEMDHWNSTVVPVYQLIERPAGNRQR